MKIETFKSYNLSKLLLYANTMERLLGKHSNFRLFLSVIYNMFMTSYQIKYIKNESSKPILFINTSEVARDDIIKMWKDVENTVDKQSYNELLVNRNPRLCLKKSLVCIFSLFSWICILKKKCPEFGLLLAVLYLEVFLDIIKELENFPNLSKYRLCVFFYDARPIDNFLSQYMQLKGIDTVTLQHGTMLAKRPTLYDNLDYCGVEFESFVSTYFLGWNDFTKNEAIKSGIPNNKFVTLGCAKCINAPYIQNASESKILGLILDGVFEEENNKSMIDILNKFCLKEGYRYIARFHPSYPKEKMENLNIDSRYGWICPKEKSLFDFMGECALCIVSNSTVLFEFEAMGYPFMRYSSNNVKDKYKDFTVPSFTNEAELSELFHSGRGIRQSEGNGLVIYNNYKKFFDNYLL